MVMAVIVVEKEQLAVRVVKAVVHQISIEYGNVVVVGQRVLGAPREAIAKNAVLQMSTQEKS